MASFLNGVNRLLRINNIIKGDDDNITTFDDTQHASDIELAQLAIQDELGEIVSERLIPYEKTSDSISLVTGTRTYSLASDFVRFFGYGTFYDATENVRIFQLKGGEEVLQVTDYSYTTSQGYPNWWYWDNTTTKSVGFYLVPSASLNGRSLSYDYEASVDVTTETDTLPFHNNEEYYAFIAMAARRFRFMLTDQEQGLLTQDATYNNAKARLYNFIRPTNPSQFYGFSYR